MKDFEEIRDTDPLSLKKLNDQLRLLWYKTKNITIRDSRLYGTDGKPILNRNGILQTWGDSVADNVAPGYKLRMFCYIPDETIEVRKMLLHFRLEPFRAYSTGAASGGSVSTTSGSGGSTSTTSSSGGGVSTSSGSGGGTTKTTTSGGSVATTSGSGGGATKTSGASSSTTTGSGGSTTATSAVSGTQVTNPTLKSGTTYLNPESSNPPKHSHGFDYQDFPASSFNGHTHSVTIGSHSHSLSHTHDVTIDSHSHSINIAGHSHDVTIGDHSHSISISDHSHSFSIGSHSHSVSIGSHTHDINYGIYESTLPQNVRVYIDGTQRLDLIGYNANQAGLLITDYVQEPGWHTIELSSDRLGRINCAYFLQAFIGF